MKEKTYHFEKERACCPVCDGKVHGRSDKIYCTPKCKDKAYARTRKEFAFATRVVMKQLARNHFVLDLMGGDSDQFTIAISQLKHLGFDPKFVTGIEHNKYGHKYQLFNYSWYAQNTQNIVVYRNKQEHPLSEFTYKRWQKHHEKQARTWVDGPPPPDFVIRL